MEIREDHYNPTQRKPVGPKKVSVNQSIRLPLFISMALVVGMLIGSNMMDAPPATGRSIGGNFSKLREVLRLIDDNYVDEVDSEALVEEAIDNMLTKLDPHTSYIPAEQLEMVQAQLQGGFEGIGIEFNIIRDTLYVVTPLSGGPSEAAGLQTGDQIIEVDGEQISGPGLTNSRVHEVLRGEKGTEVTLTIKRKRESELLEFTLERDKIPTYAVDAHYMIDEQTGYIKVNRFSATVYDEYLEALTELKEKGMKRLVLDLQGNPGGLLDEATEMVDEILGGEELIVYTDGKERRFDQRYYAEREGIAEDMPVIVLVNEGSASASEIVAGALQDNDRALIVGRRSFGKGLVQVGMSLSDGSELRLTISRYYTPSGRSIQKPFGEEISYDNDITERYANGEFFNADSVKVNDSLQYATKNGRAVYGGGGIMPDVFVPLDTASSTRYMRELFYSNAIREFSLFYVEENKRYLEDMSFATFKDNFEVTDAMLQQLIEVGEQNGVDFNRSEYNTSKSLIANRLKAFIARGIWDNNGFYPIINEDNEVYREALLLFDQAEDLLSN
ncbi:MAG TPA: peptidase S41 [Cytophagales bacterium]|nr:peptidase S41 [Cytophagales bacterium]HAP63225.1 peptidase S41 [Cytophagales bacterium]